MIGIPPNDEALSNNSIKGMLKAKSKNIDAIISFCSCRFFIFGFKVNGLGFKRNILSKSNCLKSNKSKKAIALEKFPRATTPLKTIIYFLLSSYSPVRA